MPSQASKKPTVHKVQLVNTAFRDPATMIAASIAIVALLVSLWQGIELRKHNRISVRPSLDISSDLSSSEGFKGLSIENQGPGFARVRAVWLEIDGEVVDTGERNGWPTATRALGVERYVSYRTFYDGDVIAAGERLPYFGIFPKKLDEDSRKELKNKLGSLTINICYCSIYEECELYTTGYHKRSKRLRVDTCVAPGPSSPVQNEQTASTN